MDANLKHNQIVDSEPEDYVSDHFEQ